MSTVFYFARKLFIHFLPSISTPDYTDRLLHLYKCNYIIKQIYNNVNTFFDIFRFKSKEIIRKDLFIMNKKIELQIGNNIRCLRERNGRTQESLAEQLQLNGCDITRSAVAKIEVGQRHLYPDEIILIKKILNVSYEEIFSIPE